MLKSVTLTLPTGLYRDTLAIIRHNRFKMRDGSKGSRMNYVSRWVISHFSKLLYFLMATRVTYFQTREERTQCSECGMGSIGNSEEGVLAVVLGLADYIPRVSKRTGDSVNTFGPNIQPTSSDGPDALSEHLYLLPCDLYLLSADSHNDTHSLCFQILVKSSSALPSHSFAMLNKSAECLRHISSYQPKYCISAGCIG